MKIYKSPIFFSQWFFTKFLKSANFIFKTSSVFNCNCNCLVPLQYWRTSHCNIEFNGIVCTVVVCYVKVFQVQQIVDTHYDLECRPEVFGTKLKFCQTILTLSAFVISFSVLSEDKLKVHVHAVYRKTSLFFLQLSASLCRHLN